VDESVVYTHSVTDNSSIIDQTSTTIDELPNKFSSSSYENKYMNLSK